MRIIIPTRNRPTSLSGVFRYYEKFYPKARILLADGSDDSYKSINAQLAKETSLDIDYRPFESEMSLFDRLLAVLADMDDQYIVMAADDDYPILETLEKGRRRLEKDPDATCAGGFLVHINVLDAHSGNARFDPVRQITAPTAARRMQVFGQFPFTTTYAVARRERLIERYEFLKQWNMPGFFDLGVGLMDVAEGKFLAIPEMGFICTRNYVHSYFRSNDRLVYLRRAPEVLELYDMLTEKLVEKDGLSREEARGFLEPAINKRVAALAGAPPFRIVGFTERAPYKTDMIARTKASFADLFNEGTQMRNTYDAHLALIAKNLASTVASADNAGEEAKYEFL